MSTTHTHSDDDSHANNNQAIEHAEATDAESIRSTLPDDIRAALTKRAFSPGALRILLRDTYYMGPIGIGRGGWRGMYGDGQPGTEMRRPNGALYNFPRSWRYAALERALETGLIAHVGGGRFTATERGVAVLHQIDRCPECDEVRVPMVQSSYYTGNPFTEGHIENHRLRTQCPECGGEGYNWGSGSTSFDEYERTEDRIESATAQISEMPQARTYGGSRDVDPSAADERPTVDEAAITETLENHVEEHTPGTPREIFGAHDEDLYERQVVTIDGDGEHFRFTGTDEAFVVTHADTTGEIHFTLTDSGRLRAHMSYEVAVEQGAKDAIKSDAADANWTGDHWTIDPSGLPHAASVLAGFEKYYGRWTVTATEEAVAACQSPVPGIDADGALMDKDDLLCVE